MRIQDFEKFNADYQMIKTFVDRIKNLNEEIKRLEDLTTLGKYDETKEHLFSFLKDSNTNHSEFICMRDNVNKFISYKILLLKELRSELIEKLARFDPVMMVNGMNFNDEKDTELEALIRDIDVKISTIGNIEFMKTQNLGINYPPYTDLVNETKEILNKICEKEGLSLSD